MTLLSFFRKRPAVAFFGLAYAFTWLVWGLRAVLSPQSGVPDVLLVALHMLGAFGPCAAAVLLTAQAEGRAGVRRLFAPYLHWKVGAGWYAFVLLTRPLIWLAALGLYALSGLKLSHPGPVDWGFFAAYFVSQLLVVGVGEELGWNGFALPRLRGRYHFLTANLILGVLWGLWHLPMFFTPGDSQYGSSLLLFVIKLTAFRCLFSLAYERTGSLLMPALFHVSFNVLTELVPLSPSDPLAVGLSLVFIAAVLVTIEVRTARSPGSRVGRSFGNNISG